MLPIIGGAMFGYGLANKRRGLMIVGGIIAVGSVILTSIAIARMQQQQPGAR